MTQFVRRNLYFLVVLLGILASAWAQEGSGDYEDLSTSYSQSESDSLAAEDKNPCSFRGSFLLHGESTRLDPCTECVCKNGTTTCNIESCPPDLGCTGDEVVIIPEECCPQCPYELYVEKTSIMNLDPVNFTIGESKRVRFGVDIAIDKKETSRIIRGEGLWKIGAWISANGDGSGRKKSYRENVLGEGDQAKEYAKPEYPPWQFTRLRYNMNFQGGGCNDFKYFCVEFGPGSDPEPKYDLGFTVEAVDNEQERLRDCQPLGKCSGAGPTDAQAICEPVRAEVKDAGI